MYQSWQKEGSGPSGVGLKCIFAVIKWNLVISCGKQTSPQTNVTPPSHNLLSSETRCFSLLAFLRVLLFYTYTIIGWSLVERQECKM